MSDVGIFFVNNCFQLVIEDGDLKGDDGLETAVTISLFTDRRARIDELPEGTSLRRGWWGDLFPTTPGDQIGSKLWTVIDRGKVLPEIIPVVEAAARESLDWMIREGVASAVSVEASIDDINRLNLAVSIVRPEDLSENRFAFLWEGQEIVRMS